MPNTKLPYFLKLAALLMLYVPAAMYAQQTANLPLKQLSTQDGLSDNNIKCIAQDEVGYLWIGTEYGLCRYDGKNILRFFAGDNTIPLPGNNVSHLKYLGNDEMGISTSEGLLLLNTKTFAHRTFKVADSGAISYYQNNVWDCISLPDNRIGISTCTGFYVFDRNGNLQFRYDRYTADDLSKRLLWGREIYKAGDNRIVILGDGDNYAVFHYTNNKLELFQQGDGKKKEWPFLTNKEIRKINISGSALLVAHQRTDTVFYFDFITGKGPDVRLPFALLPNLNWNAKILQVNDSSMLLNLISGGVVTVAFEAETKKLHFSSIRNYSNLRPYCHFIDRDKRLWIGTINGMYGQQLRQMAVRKLAIPNLFEENTGAASILCHGQKIFIGCYNKRSTSLKVYSQNGDSLLSEISFFDPASDWNEIASISLYKGDTVLIGTRAGVLWLNSINYHYGQFNPLADQTNFFNSPFMILLPPDEKGTMWLLPKHSSTAAKYNIYTRNFFLFNNKSNPALPVSDVKHFVKDVAGKIWIGGKGLCSYNEITNRFDTVMFTFSGRNKYSSNVTNLGTDKNGLLWIQTAENNLVTYDSRKNIFTVLKGSTGFPEGITHALSNNTGWNLVIAQSNRLIDYNLAKDNYRIIGILDGLPPGKPLSEMPIYYDSTDNRYFIVYPKTVAIYTPQQPRPSGIKRLIINELILNNKRHIFHPDSSIRVSNKENKISIHYSVPDLESSPEYIFYYKLNNNDWVYNGNSRLAELGTLESGKHYLIIKSIDPEGNELVTKQHLYIIPPIWKRWWFSLLSILAAITIIVFLYKKRIRKLKRKSETDIRMKDLEMKALQVQMNPHFVFNALNSIKEMILTDKRDEASRYLSKFGYLLRLNLTHNTETFITLAENNKQLQAYLEMESLRFANFTWSVNMEADIDEKNLLIPPMVMQPIVENAIWHGLLSSNTERNLKISYSMKDQQLICTTEDNGIGINTARSTKSNGPFKSVGLDNIRSRLNLLQKKYGGRFSLEIVDKLETDNSETGTVATLAVPIIHA